MARYNGPKTKISRIFGEPILGNGKWLGKNSNPPGQHGAQRKRKTLGEYALQLREKQKAKYTYGVLEKQFRKTFEEASAGKVLPVKISSNYWKLVWTIPYSAWVLHQAVLLPAVGKP
jgi:ribosomal protein S4